MNEVKLEMKQIGIEFPGVKALDQVDFSVTSGTIHALVGANGAGKSTLMKVLAGINPHYTGQIYLAGEPVQIRTPKDAKRLGIELVFQEVDAALVPYLSVAENVMFHTLVNGMGKKQLVNWRSLKKRAKEVLQRLNVDVDINAAASDLTLAQKQMVLIARCVAQKCNFLILDEPTAPLSGTETLELFRVVRQLARENVGIVFISHRIRELYVICEQVTILRDGKSVAHMALTADLEIDTIVAYMLGHKLAEVYEKCSRSISGTPPEKLLETIDLSEKNGKVSHINMVVREGEIIGIAGLVGAGKTELCKTLFGSYRHNGVMKLHGKECRLNNPEQAVKQGLALVPEERRKEGIFAADSVYANISIAAMGKYTNVLSVVNRRKEKEDALRMIQKLGIKTPSETQPAALLSGGNQQKVVVSKWLNADAFIYIFDEPTKGIDVGAKRDMYQLIEGLALKGKGAIYATCEFEEILNICDRVYVMYDGRFTKELQVSQTDEKELLYYATGGK